MSNLPRLSIATPTLNSERTLPAYFAAIEVQDYPPDRIELIIADGGSTDATVSMAKARGARVVRNKLRTAEAGKAIALRNCRNELVLLLDSDNVLVGHNWLRLMVSPFEQPSIVGAEPLRFCAEPCDSIVDRYCALAGVGDPLCIFLGNYDRQSAITGSWTGLATNHAVEDYGLSFALKQRLLPTIGANGTIYRRGILEECLRSNLGSSGLNNFNDIDVPYMIANSFPTSRFAKVNVGIRHLYCADVAAFVRKQTRRVRDFLSSRRDQTPQAYPWKRFTPKIALFCLATMSTLPLIWQAAAAYRRSGDRASFFHPVACWLTLLTYGANVLFAGRRPLSRRGWRQ